MRYDEIQDNPKAFPLIEMKSSEYSPNQCVFRNDEFGVWLYQANCIEFMDMLISKYPDGRFDMIFADPPLWQITHKQIYEDLVESTYTLVN